MTEFDNATLKLNWDVTHLLTHENRAFADAEVEVLDGKITADRGSYAKWKSNSSATLNVAQWQLGYSVRFIGKADDENGGGSIGSSVPSIVYHDLQARYSFSEHSHLSLGIDNIFDKSAPYLTSWNDANTDVFTYDTVERRGYLKFNYQY